jgi:Skp family chaperone for outer membrane proteins
MKKYLIGAAIAALAIPGAASAQRGATPGALIVVVDSSRVFGECNACRAATAQLQGMVSQAQQRQQALGAPLQTEAQSLRAAAQAASAMPAGPAKTAAENSVNQRAQALQGRQDAANQELQRLDQNLQSVRANVSRQLNASLGPIYQQVMTAHGANLALDVEATLAHSNALDVTTEVLAALNAALPSVNVTPLPQPAAPPGQPQGR